ncbi:MAG TPA: beta-L-arabinofuranosidase domain-containing protein [bacterium]|nr:beta-L-arabinofuranosidase domain-containing protein [bacterium]
MIESPKVTPRPFPLTKVLIVLIAVLLPLLGWLLYQRWQKQKWEDRGNILEPAAFKPLPLGAVKPQGWLLEQLKLQAGGLSGHLDEFWPDVAKSGWIGGPYEGWERAPYWLDGFIPLAFLTGDAKLEKDAKRWVDYILEHSLPDGWLGPERGSGPHGSNAYPNEARDPWPQFIILKALAQYQEATGDPRIIPAMERDLKSLDFQLDQRHLFAWNFFRWQDCLVTLFWLYDRTGEPWLLDLARKVAGQGYNWSKHFNDLPVKDKSPRWNWEGHVVNNAMGLKAPAVLWRLTGIGDFKKMAPRALEEIDRYHGEANGLFSGDECLAGRSPSQGTELCAIVEFMFSLENDLSALGDPLYADRLEKIAFNALPAAFTVDYWQHQYVEQANQVVSGYFPKPIYTTNTGDANLFGLEPHYGCCTANMHQGWPKFVTHLWMGSPDGGLVAAAYSPCSLETTVGPAKVRVEETTDYPFSEALTFTLQPDREAEFPLYLRAPQWCEGASARLPDGSVEKIKTGTYRKFKRPWKAGDRIVLTLPMHITLREGYQKAESVERGPLVYSLGLKEQWVKIAPFRDPVKGEKKFDMGAAPLSPWNYALALDLEDPGKSLEFQPGSLKGNPFTLEGAPSTILVKGRKLDFWTVVQGAAEPPPKSPVKSSSALEDLHLVPYGSTRLRVTEFPVLE